MDRLASRNIAWSNLGFAVVISAAAGVASLSSGDADARALRYGMILMTAGAAFWLPVPALILAVPALWFGPNYVRAQTLHESILDGNALLELPGLLLLALGIAFVRQQQRTVEEQANAFDGLEALKSELDEETGVYQERLLRESIERELVRSRRFGREFAVMLADIDPMRVKFDYREDEKWEGAFKATAQVLLNTRIHIDRVFRYGDHAFALLLPETGARDISGLLRRLSRAAKKASPPEGEPGGPLPLHFGVTFFPNCATTVEDLLKRAEVALRIAEKNANRVQLDGAEAPDLPSPESLRKDEDEEQVVEALAGQWLGAEAPEEEQGSVWQHSPPAAVAKISSESPSRATLEEVGAEMMPELAAGFVAEDVDAGQPADGVEVEPAIQREAGSVPAETWHALEPATVSVPPPAADAALSGELAEMLKRMNETLAMFRDAKA